MLLKHGAAYFLARGIPGLINFAALAVYTRLLTPESYGQYAVIIASVGLLNAFLFQWIHLGLLRYLPSYKKDRRFFLSTVILAYIVVGLLTTIFGGLSSLLYPDGVSRSIIVLAVVILWVQAFFEINQQIYISDLKPLIYGLFATARALITLLLASMLLLAELDFYGLLVAIIFGLSFPVLVWGRSAWRGISFSHVDKELLKTLIMYGLPLSATLALSFIISSSDRLMLGWMQGAEQAGLYSVGYDLASFTLTLLMMVVNLAAYPLAIRVLEQDGNEAAKKQLSQNFTFLFSIGTGAATGLTLVAPNLCSIILGEDYSESAVMLIPWISFAALIAGMKSYYFDLGFQLGKNTIGQTWVVLFAALLNVFLNLILIPRYEFMGAVYATLLSYMIATLLSGFYGRRWFILPIPALDAMKVILSASMMGLFLLPFYDKYGTIWLVAQLIIGLLSFLTTAFALNMMNMRKLIWERLRAL